MTKNKIKLDQFFTDLLERVGSTFLQVFLATLLATSAAVGATAGNSAVVHVSWLHAVLVALGAALVCLLTTVIQWLLRLEPLTNAYADLVLRTALTFGQTLLGYLLAAGSVSVLDFNWNAALVASAVAAGQALLKGLIGLNSDTAGASVLLHRTSSRRHSAA